MQTENISKKKKSTNSFIDFQQRLRLHHLLRHHWIPHTAGRTDTSIASSPRTLPPLKQHVRRTPSHIWDQSQPCPTLPKLPSFGTSPRAVHTSFFLFIQLGTNCYFLLVTDKKLRDKATESLSLFLRSKTDLTLIELLKLWKGLFFCTPATHL